MSKNKDGLKVGDVVRLKTGEAPEMTVEALGVHEASRTAVALVVWFNGGELRRDTLPEGALSKVV